MKKVLILANNDIGLYNFRKEIIKKLIESGYSVYVSLPQGERIQDLIDMGCIYYETPIDRRGMNLIKDLKLLILYEKIVKEIDPDVILSYTIKPNIYGGLIARLKKKKYIANITGIGSVFQAENLIKKVISFLYRFSLKKAEFVFFQNQENMDIFEGNKIRGKKKLLIPGSGVNIHQFLPIAIDQEKESLDFIFIGRIMKEKGIEEYLYAAKKIKEEYKYCKFHIIGSMEELEYEKVLRKYVEEKIIIYHGFDKDIQKYINNSDCVVLPSYHEGMSNVLLESGASARPLIASNISGCKEIIDENSNGYTFKVGDKEDLVKKINQFISLNKDERKCMGQKSRKKIENEFDRTIIVSKYKVVIDNLIGGDCND